MDAVTQAFSSAPELRIRIKRAQAQSSDLQHLFTDIASFVRDQTQIPSTTGDPVTKKRKLEAAANGTDNHNRNEAWEQDSIDTLSDISFAVPVRKKLRLEIGDQGWQGIQGMNPQAGACEVAIRWRDIEHVACLPVPEKAQQSYNFCIFPVNGAGLNNSSDGDATQDQMVWNVPATAPKPAVCNTRVQAGEDESYRDILLRILNARLRKHRKDISKVAEPDEKDFVSELAQAHRKGEKAYHVKAFRGSKDGFLFFLSIGVVWGFKKPLALFAFDTIESVSYTSVLQRTFNLNITTRTEGNATQEFEFSMIDQADFVGINAYIKKNELQDASMAEQRRAKKYNVNSIKGEENGEDEEDGPGELEKASQEARQAGADEADDEEEEDENFDPGSEGESEGSGSSSEGDEDEQMAGDDDDAADG